MIPKAWDYIFSKQESYNVRIILSDNTVICGVYGSKSFTSSFPHEEDIFLEQLWIKDEDDWFDKINPVSQGVLISRKDIKRIEFYKAYKKGENSG